MLRLLVQITEYSISFTSMWYNSQKEKTVTDDTEKEHEILHKTIQQQALGEDRHACGSAGLPETEKMG